MSQFNQPASPEVVAAPVSPPEPVTLKAASSTR